MASDGTGTGSGKTAFGGDWKVGTDGTRLIVLVDGFGLVVSGAEWEKFAEAVARTLTPGRLVKHGNHGPGCQCTPCSAAYPEATQRAEASPCRACLGTGLIPVEKCNCGSPADVSVGYIHERLCGYEPCPAGCPVEAGA